MSAEPSLEWPKWAAIREMAVFAKDGIEVRNLSRAKPALFEPPESVYGLEMFGKTEAQEKNGDLRNQEKRIDWEKRSDGKR